MSLNDRHLATLLLLFLPHTAFGVAWSLRGETGTNLRPPADIDSSSEIDCLGIFGGPEPNCQFYGFHSISNAVDSSILVNKTVTWNGSQWIDYIRRTGIGGNCYQSHLTGQIVWSGNTYDWDGNQACIPNPPDKPPKDDCPVIIDLDGGGFHLTGLNDPVWFDLDASGTAEELGWTAPDVLNGFLCLDRNHDGLINDGRELFGQVTPLANGQPAKIGYVALAQLDRPELGGNGDGVIGPEDAAYRDLCVWVDANHDGISQPGEILTLPQAGIARLAYDYVESRRQDQYGNLFRYRSRAWLQNPAGRVREVSTYDVFFVHR